MTILKESTRDNGKSYVCTSKHRDGREGASRWRPDVSYDDEFGIFCRSDDEDWTHDSGATYWGVLIDGEKAVSVGTAKEGVAKFRNGPIPRPGSPWHGYPARPDIRDNDVPPEQVVMEWIDREWVTRAQGKRVLRRQRCGW